MEMNLKEKKKKQQPPQKAMPAFYWMITEMCAKE